MGKARRIGIITAYIDEDWHSQQLARRADLYGDVVVIRPEQLAAEVTDHGVYPVAVGVDIDSVDAFVLARGFGERGNPDFLIPVYRMLEDDGKIMVNSISAVLAALDKFETSCRLQESGIPTPDVIVMQDMEMGEVGLQRWGRVVAKPLYGSLGMGIELVEDTAQGRQMLDRMLASYGAVYLQEYVPVPGRDIRAFVVGDRVVASMFRKAVPGEWRTNIHRGATGEPCLLESRTASMAVEAAKALGLDYTGVDILEGPRGPIVIEVNGNPLWQGLLHATGQNMADDIIAWVVARIEREVAKGGERVA